MFLGRFFNQLLGGLNLRGVVGMAVLGDFLIDLGVFGDVGSISSWWVVFGSSVELVLGAVLVNRILCFPCAGGTVPLVAQPARHGVALRHAASLGLTSASSR